MWCGPPPRHMVSPINGVREGCRAAINLRQLRAALKNAEIDKMKPLEEEDVIDTISRETKKLKRFALSFH